VVGAVALAFAWTALRPAEAVAEPQRLAVLPFNDLGDEAESLSAGLVETVTAKLAQLDPLRAHVRVVPASEVGPGLTPSEARERFGATLVLEGTVQAEGGRVRVTLSLVDVGGGAPSTLGSREVDDASGSAFALQDAAVLEVADLLRIEVGVASRESLTAGGTTDPEANELYLRGRGRLRDQQSAADLERARALFVEAIAEDPAFALAYAGLSEAEWETYRSTGDVAWAERAIANAERALDLDDRLPAVHTARGKIYRGLGDYEPALEALDRALALDPDDPEAARQLALVYSDMGRAREAEAAFRRAITLAPDSWRAYNSFGSFYLAQGRDADAARQYRRALAAAPTLLGLRYNLGVAAYRGGDPEEARRAFEGVLGEDSLHVGATVGLMGVLFTLGDYQEAATVGERAVALLPEDYGTRFGLAQARWWSGARDLARQDYQTALVLARETLRLGRTPDVLVTMAGVFAAAGRVDSARVYLDEIESTLDPNRVDVSDAYAVGVAYAILGDRDRALSWLERTLARGYGRVQAQRSPWLAELRDSPRFQTLVD
jgi:tetratricopeptide (TPR) repeat protein